MNQLITSFNNVLITILNKLHYVITFIKPETLENDVFLVIKYIQTESQTICLYDSSFVEMENIQYYQILFL